MLKVRHLASCIAVFAGLGFAGCRASDTVGTESFGTTSNSYEATATVLGLLPDPVKVQRRLDQIRKRQFRCEAYVPDGPSALRVLRFRLPGSALPVDIRKDVKLVSFALSNGADGTPIQMQCGIPVDADPLLALAGLSYRTIAKAIDDGEGTLFTRAHYREFVTSMTSSARIESRRLRTTARGSVIAQSVMAIYSDPLCSPNTAPSAGCTLLTGVTTTAPWEGVFAGFFFEPGDSDNEIDPWTPGSDTELPTVDDPDTRCEYDCTPGGPPPCPTLSPLDAEMTSEMADAMNACPQGMGTSSSKVCIDLWIAACVVKIGGTDFVATKGDCRPDEPNAPIERSRAQFVVDLTNGAVVYDSVNQSCWASTALNQGCVPPLPLRNSPNQTYPLTNHYSVAHSNSGTIVTITLIHSLWNAGTIPIQPQVQMQVVFGRRSDGGYDIVKLGDGFPSIAMRRGNGSGGWESSGAIFHEGSWWQMSSAASNVTCVGSLPPS